MQGVRGQLSGEPHLLLLLLQRDLQQIMISV
jgi:hypothetical protein